MVYLAGVLSSEEDAPLNGQSQVIVCLGVGM